MLNRTLNFADRAVAKQSICFRQPRTQALTQASSVAPLQLRYVPSRYPLFGVNAWCKLLMGFGAHRTRPVCCLYDVQLILSPVLAGFHFTCKETLGNADPRSLIRTWYVRCAVAHAGGQVC